MFSSDDDSDSSYDAPNLRLFAVRGSRRAAAEPEPEPEPSDAVQRGDGAPDLEPINDPNREPELGLEDDGPAVATCPPATAGEQSSAVRSSPAVSLELQELTQKVAQLEAMNRSPPPALHAEDPLPANDGAGVSVSGATPQSSTRTDMSLDTQLQAALSATAQLRLELSAKEAEMKTEREQQETNSRKALKILQTKDEELDAKDGQLRVLAAANERDGALVSELRENVARLSALLRDQEEQLAQAREENDELRATKSSVGEARAAQTEADSTVGDAEHQLTTIRDLEQRLQDSMSRNASLEAAVAQASGQRSAVDAQAAAAHEYQRKQLLDQMAADTRIHQAALSEKDARIGQLEAQLAEAEQMINTLRTHGREAPASPVVISPTTHDKRLTAMEQLLSVDVDGEDHVTAHLPQVDVQRDQSVLADLKQALDREASLKAELDEAVEAQSKLQGLVHRMGAERDGLYAEIDEARAAAIQLEDSLDNERKSWGQEKTGLERQLSQRIDEINGLKSAALPAQICGDNDPDRDRSPRFQELTTLAADDAVFQMQVKELEGELQSAHVQLAARRDEVKKLQAQVEKLESVGQIEQTRKSKRRVDADQAATEKGKELGRCKQQLRAAAEENTRLNERILKLEKLQGVAKSSALKAEKELESLRTAAQDATRRHESDIASRSRHQEQLERRLQAAEAAHEQSRSELAAKEAELRELRELDDLSPTSAAHRLERFDSTHVQLKSISDSHVDWHSKEEAYRTEVSSLKHEVHQVRMRLRSTVAAKATREHELEQTVKRLGRRSKLHECVEELSAQLSLSQSETNRMRIEVESLQLEKDHVKGELHRKTDRIEQLEMQVASYSQDDAREQSHRKLEALMDENRQLDELLKAAQQEFEERADQDKNRDIQLRDLASVRKQLKEKQAEVLRQQLTEESNQEALVALERSCSDLRTQLSETQRRLCVSQQEAATRSTEDASRHAKEICATEQRAREREQEAESLRKKLSAMSDETRQLKAALQAAEDSVSAQRADCEQRLASTAEETNRIRREACQCVSENERLHSIVEEKIKQIGLLQESFDVLRDGDTDSIQQQVVLLVAHLEDSSSSHCELERRLAEMQGALQGQVIDFTALQREAATMLSKLGMVSADLSTSQKLLHDRETEISQMRLEFATTHRELGEVQHEVDFLTKKTKAAEGQLAAMQAEHAKKEQENIDKAAATAAEHDRSVQGLKLQILELQHEADNKLPLSTVEVECKSSELVSELKKISQQLQECCTGIAESEPGMKDNWCSRVDAALDAYEAAILSQSKQLGTTLQKNQELLTETLCASHTTKALQAHVQELTSKLQVATRKGDALQGQLDGMRSQIRLARNSLAESLQQKNEALVAELAEAKKINHAHVSANERLTGDVEMLQQQLAQSQRALAVVGTGKSENSNALTGDTEERVSRLRAFFEAEVARLVSIPADTERLQEMSQQLAASKIMEDDLRMKAFSLDQQKDILLTDAVVLKDVIRALEADLNQLQTAAQKIEGTGVPQARILEMQSTIAELRTDAEVERQCAGQFSARVSQLEQQLRQAEEQNDALKQEMPLKLRQAQEAMQNSRQEELASLHKEHFEQKTKQAEEIFALQSELKQIMLSEPRNRSSTETSICQSVTTTALNAGQLGVDMDMDLENTRKELTQLADKNSELVEQLADSRAEIASSAATISELESALTILDQHSKKQGKHLKKKKDWNSTGAADSVAALSRKYAAAQANLANAKRQLRTHEKRERALQHQLHERDAHIQELAAQHEKAELELESEDMADGADVASRNTGPKGNDDERQEQELRNQLAKAEASSKESASQITVLTTAVEQLSTQLHEATQVSASAGSRGRGARKSSSYNVLHSEKGGHSRPKSKLAAIESSQRLVIEKLQSEIEALRTQLRELELDRTSASRSAEALEGCFGYMQTVALSVAGITPLLEIVTPKDSLELTETESIIRNISIEFENLRHVCDTFADHSISPIKTRPKDDAPSPIPDIGAKLSDPRQQLSAGVHRELHRTLWDVVNYSGRTLYGHLVNSLPQFFRAIDKESSGIITRAELREACVRLDIGLSQAQLDQLVASIDENKDGGISMTEFERWMKESGWVRRNDAPGTNKDAAPSRSQSQTERSVASTPNRSRTGGLKQKVAELETQISEINASHARTKRQLQENGVRYDNLTTDHRQLLRKLENAERSQAELQDKATSREVVIAELKTSKRQLLHRVEQLQAALVQVEQTSVQAAEQPNVQEEQHETIRALKSELDQQKADAEAAAEKLRLESAHAALELRNAVEAAESEVTRLQQQAHEAAATAAEMSAEEREQMSQQLEDVQRAMQLKEAEMDSTVEKIATMQKAYADLQVDLQAAEQAAQSEVEIGASEAEGLRAQLEAVQAESGDLRERLEAAEEQLEGARAECGSLRDLVEQQRKQKQKPRQKQKQGQKQLRPRQDPQVPTVDANDNAAASLPQSVETEKMAKTLQTLQAQKAELQQLLEDAESARGEQAAQRVVVESELRKASAKSEKWKTRHKNVERKLRESRAECAGLREQLRGASERLSQMKKDGEKAVRAKGKQGQSELEALRAENLRKAGVIEELRGADGVHVREKQTLLERAESAEARAKSLSKELARRVESVTEARAQNATVKALAEQKTAAQEALEKRVKDLLASNGRKDVTARTLKLRIEELQAENGALRSGHSEAAEELVAQAEAAKKEAAKIAKSDLARKEERIQLLAAKVSELSAALSRKERSGGAAVSTSRELRWLQGAVKRTLSQLVSENMKLQLRLPLSAGPSGTHSRTQHLADPDNRGHSSGGEGEVAALSNSVLSDLLDDLSGSDADSVVIGGYRSETDIGIMRTSTGAGRSNGTSTGWSAANANPHEAVLMRRSANEPLAIKATAKEVDKEEEEFAHRLGDENFLQATRRGGRKGKAPRVGEVKKWLANLVEDVSGGMEEKLAVATITMSAAGQQGHGGLETLVSLLVTERLSLERAVVAASKARSVAAAAAAATTAAPAASAQTTPGDKAVAARVDSDPRSDVEKQLTLITQRYESQISAIRKQVLHEQQSADRTIAELRRRLGE